MVLAIPQAGSAPSKAIAALVSQYGELPDAYRRFLKAHDGAAPPENVVRGTDYAVGVRSFLPASDILKTAKSTDGLSSELIPIAEDDCGNFICIGARNHKLYFWDHEVDRDEIIAADFDDFLERLEPIDITKIPHKMGKGTLVWVDPDFKPEFD